MANDIDATIAHVLGRIKEIPARLDAALRIFEDKVRAAGAELDAASAVANQIVDSASKLSADLHKRTKALDEAFKETARSLASG